MKECSVKLNTPNDAALFVAKCGMYDCDIDYYFGRYVIDAKSLMGVLSTGLDHVCTVIIHTDSAEVAANFKKDISIWTVEEE